MRSRKNIKKMRKTRKSRKQKLWKQKGCSKSRKRIGGGCGCGGLPFIGGKMKGVMKGGNPGCSMCSLANAQQGGDGLSPNPPAPAFVGASWTPAISGWPGVSGQAGVTNHYSMNKYEPYDPQTEVMQERAGSLFLGKYTGGKKSSKKSIISRKKRGGGLIPQDLVNFGRTFTYGLGSAYNSINGYAQPVNPLPYKDQLVQPKF
jgi:hypothetical protein